jgi:hypothetical protein
MLALFDALLPAPSTLMPRSSLLNIACGALVGTTIALAVLPLGFISGNGPFWLRPKYDINAYVTTWEYFVRDGWRFPVLSVPALGYPEGGSVLFTDGLPIGQLASKAFYTVTGIAINPFGWWILLTYVLQGAMAARVVVAVGARSLLASVAAAVLAISCTFFMGRLWHIAISSHFLILWALALYFENVRQRRFAATEHFALTLVTLLVNAYLFVMVGLLQGVTFLALWKARALTGRDWLLALCGGGGLGVLGLILGFDELFSGTANLRAAGFGLYSWNLSSLIVPPERYWGAHGIIRDATLGQAEGESYLGAGNLLVLIACVIATRRQFLSQLRQHWLLVVAVLLSAAFAASNRVYAGSTLLLDAHIPDAIMNAASLFRASGRFIWVPAYAMILVALAGFAQSGRTRIIVPVLLIALAAQGYEARQQMRPLTRELRSPWDPLVDESLLRSWMSGHNRLFQFTSWSCGGLWDQKPDDRVLDSFREMQINLLAARMGLATNTVYTSRQVKNCTREALWPIKPRLASHVLYLVNKREFDTSYPLATLLRSESCLDAGWAYVCSVKKLRAPEARVAAELAR